MDYQFNFINGQLEMNDKIIAKKGLSCLPELNLMNYPIQQKLNK
jgi:hypothetical protein